MWFNVDEMVRILESGANIVATAAFINGQSYPDNGRQRILDACANGGSSMFGSGVSPGYIELVAIALANASDRIDCLLISEEADTTAYDSPPTEIPVGFGRPLDDPELPAMTAAATIVFSEAVALVGDALGVVFDELVCEAEYAKTTKELDLGSWTLAKDTVAGVTIHWLGKMDRATVVEMRVRWRKGDALEPDWQVGMGWTVEIQGRPTITTKIDIPREHHVRRHPAPAPPGLRPDLTRQQLGRDRPGALRATISAQFGEPARIGSSRRTGQTAVMLPHDARRLLCALGDHVRDLVVGARGIDMAAIEGKTSADTIYAIDRVADETLVEWFDTHWPDVELVSEGLESPVLIGADPRWTVIVDSIDGTRGLMYDKRPAWCLAAAAPRGGSLGDVVAAAMTELPTTKQGLADQLSATRGGGVVAERIELRDRSRMLVTAQPSSATDLEHGFATIAKFFPPGKVALAQIETELFARLGSRDVFDDEYISSGGQLHELATGRDRFVADLRPLADPEAFACHPYDVCTAMVLEEAGGVVTDPWGEPLDVPLDTTTGVAWAGYANSALAARIGPVLAELVEGLAP